MKIIPRILTGIAVSGFFFTFAFSFLPLRFNSKVILALIGLVLFVLHALSKKKIEISVGLLMATAIAGFFSLISLFAADYNGTSDYSYATYIFSFLVWIMSAYAVAAIIRLTHGKYTVKLLTDYLAGVGVFQCLIALVIDKNQSVKLFVDRFFIGQEFTDQIGRLYGIGAALDPAGVRFSIVLILIAFVLLNDRTLKEKQFGIILYIVSFVIIGVFGNMISRTTTMGLLLALSIIILSPGIFRFTLKSDKIKIYLSLFVIVAISVAGAVSLYHSDPYYQDLFRFGFEGFFNWVETGEWYTSSTDKLNAVMWVWPQTMEAWIIGTGIFGHWSFSTDIGYCRFILYCGLIGFATFVFLFLYSSGYLAKRFPVYRYLFWTLLLLSFIVWMKVSTDIFLIYALFYWITPEEQNEDRLLYSRDL